MHNLLAIQVAIECSCNQQKAVSLARMACVSLNVIMHFPSPLALGQNKWPAPHPLPSPGGSSVHIDLRVSMHVTA